MQEQEMQNRAEKAAQDAGKAERRAAAHKRRKRMTALLIAAIALLALLAGIVVTANIFLARLLKDSEARSEAALSASPAPAASALPAADTPSPAPTASPEPTPTASPTPAPTRAPREGDLTDHFPEYDTGADADYSYQSDEIRIAVRAHIEFPEAYFVADVWVRNLDSFKTVFSNDTYRSTYQAPLEIAAHNNAILAINTDWNEGIVIRNGNIMRKNRKEWPLFVMYKDGTMKSFPKSEKLNAEKLLADGAWNSWCFAPILVEDGAVSREIYGMGRAPRTAIGYYEPGHYCLLVVDGRQEGYAAGMTTYDMADLFIELGCTEAFNLDGGQSSIMIFQDQIVNKPDDGGRDLPNMIVISEGANALAAGAATAAP